MLVLDGVARATVLSGNFRLQPYNRRMIIFEGNLHFLRGLKGVELRYSSIECASTCAAKSRGLSCPFAMF
jgi:hypothetical protein